MVGPPVQLPITPRKNKCYFTSVDIPLVSPSMPSRQIMLSKLTSPTVTSSPTASSSSTMSSSPTATSSTISAHGSDTRLAAIVTALDSIDLRSHYVVIRGKMPGVYASRFVSMLFFLFFLMF